MIKKFIYVLASFICLFSVNAFALQVDKDFYVYGQQDAQLCEVIGTTESELKEYCSTNNITFLAVNKTNTKQIRKAEVKDSFSKKAGDFSAFEDKEILDLTEELTGFSNVSGTVIEENGQKFLKVDVKTTDSGGEYIITQYITVSDEVKSTLTFYTDAKENTDYIAKVFSSQFEDSSAVLPFKVITVVGMVLFSALALVVLVAIIKDTFTKEPIDS